MKHRLLFAILAASLSASLAAALGEPLVLKPGPEEFVSSLAFYHPAIATDSKCQPHFVSDPGGNNKFAKFHRVNGRWSGGIFAEGSNGGYYDASRLYIGAIEIDGRDRAWISCKFGTKEYGSMLGYGVWLFDAVAANPNPGLLFFRHLDAKGHGMVSLDAKYPDAGVGLATGGAWDKLNPQGQVTASGTINAGPGGEKMRFRIASYAPRFGSGGTIPDGVWHTAMNGYSAFPSAYQNSKRFKNGQAPVTWAAYGTYPQQGLDYSHTGIGIDLANPEICYMGTVFGGKLAINIWDGQKMLFPANNLKILDFNAAYEMRHTIQFAPAPAYAGGTFVIWSSGGRIKLCYLSPRGVAGPIRDLTPGSMPAACADRYGNLHLVYANSGIRYRRIPVLSVAPLAPRGRTDDTRRPTFTWAGAPGPAFYTIELTRDGETQPAFTVPAAPGNSWQPTQNLAVGAWSWRVKEGAVEGKKPWSSDLAFTIPPASPVPVAPAGHSAIHPVIPSFSWTCADPEASRFSLQLYAGAGLVGTMTVTATNGPAFSADWTNTLTAGSYRWRIKAARPKPDFTVASDWSEDVEFQLGVPGLPVFTNPAAMAAFPPSVGRVDAGWLPADGAASYTLRLLRNGKAVDSVAGIAALSGAVEDGFTPAYYTLLVRGVNAAGNGPWSAPATFVVERRMVPDGTVSNRAPAEFRWTRSEPATRYLLKILQLDAESGTYVEKRSAWVSQPASGMPRWKPPYTIPDGKFRWTLTDYNGSAAGYTQTGSFTVRNSGRTSWNDPALIQGRWRVVTPWRWVEMEFLPDGVLRTVQGDGTAFTRARWSADAETLTLVSDVTERCPYQVTADRLSFTTPSGNFRELVRIR